MLVFYKGGCILSWFTISKMKESDFQQLLRNYLDGKCSEEELRLLDRWFEQIADPSLGLSVREQQSIQQKIRNDLQHNMGRREAPVRSMLWKYSIAAAIAVALLAFAWILYNNRTGFTGMQLPIAEAAEGTLRENKTNVTETITLPDGSRVLLKPGSVIAYQQKFSEAKREVKLTGEAFFDVVKDAERPFYVYGNNVVTKVLGTSFSVRSPANTRTIEVEVRTGRVSVYKEETVHATATQSAATNGVVLTPNQKVTYFIKENHWVTTLVEKPEPVTTAKEPQAFVFDNTSLQEIIERLEKEYGIEIVLENDRVGTCTFTGDVSAMPLYDILSVIGRSIGATYEIRGTTILVNGKGCD